MELRHTVTCACGEVRVRLEGPPIASVECLCSSCRRAGGILEALPGAPKIVDAKGATPFVMQRKDRAEIAAGASRLRAFRLTPGAGTKRVVATCCNTPVWIELEAGHWLSLYGLLWKDAERPELEMRTMTGDLDDPSALPDDVPNLRHHSLRFFARLLGAWVRMGFRNPKFHVEGELDVGQR